MEVPLYDRFDAYDLLINWPSRLRSEAPFFRQLFRRHRVQSVLDVACGTGRHAHLFSRWGLRVTGTDLSSNMIRRARENAVGNPSIQFLEAGFGEVQQKAPGPYDAVTCLGSSLPHLLSQADLDAALVDFHAVLNPGGLLILQNNNYDAILQGPRRFMPLASARQAGREYLFFRFFDFEGERVVFHVITFMKEGKAWSYQADGTPQRPLLKADLEDHLSRTGFSQLACYGDCRGSPFDPQESPNLVIVGIRGAMGQLN